MKPVSVTGIPGHLGAIELLSWNSHPNTNEVLGSDVIGWSVCAPGLLSPACAWIHVWVLLSKNSVLQSVPPDMLWKLYYRRICVLCPSCQPVVDWVCLVWIVRLVFRYYMNQAVRCEDVRFTSYCSIPVCSLIVEPRWEPDLWEGWLSLQTFFFFFFSHLSRSSPQHQQRAAQQILLSAEEILRRKVILKVG